MPPIFLAHLNKSLIIASGIFLLSVREKKKNNIQQKKQHIFATLAGVASPQKKSTEVGLAVWGIGVLCERGSRSFAFSPAFPHFGWNIYTNKQKFVNKNCVKGQTLRWGRWEIGGLGLVVFLRVKAASGQSFYIMMRRWYGSASWTEIGCYGCFLSCSPPSHLITPAFPHNGCSFCCVFIVV